MMNIRCNYCEYQYDVSPPEAIFVLLSDPQLPLEDYLLWMERLMKYMADRQFKAIIIHYDMKHRYLHGGLFNIELTEGERKVIRDLVPQHAV